jgi:hypothetical protein
VISKWEFENMRRKPEITSRRTVLRAYGGKIIPIV